MKAGERDTLRVAVVWISWATPNPPNLFDAWSQNASGAMLWDGGHVRGHALGSKTLPRGRTPWCRARELLSEGGKGLSAQPGGDSGGN